MNILDPVSTIMTTDLITVSPEDSLKDVKANFEGRKIHHLPVVDNGNIIGIISKSDFLYFMRGYTNSETDAFINDSRLSAYQAKDIMTKGLAKVEPSDRINVALEVFKENLFHAIPVVDNGNQLVGIVTTYDIIKKLAEG